MKRLKEVMIMLFCISFVVASFGCLPKDVTSEKGENLPGDFVVTYTLLDYSEELSTTVGNVTNDLLQRDIIDEEQKDEIGEVWVEHKFYNNKLQKEVEVWYDALNDGKEVDNKDKILHLVNKLVEETELLEKVMKEHMDGIYIPENMFDRIVNLSNLVKEK